MYRADLIDPDLRDAAELADWRTLAAEAIPGAQGERLARLPSRQAIAIELTYLADPPVPLDVRQAFRRIRERYAAGAAAGLAPPHLQDDLFAPFALRIHRDARRIDRPRAGVIPLPSVNNARINLPVDGGDNEPPAVNFPPALDRQLREDLRQRIAEANARVGLLPADLPHPPPGPNARPRPPMGGNERRVARGNNPAVELWRREQHRLPPIGLQDDNQRVALQDDIARLAHLEAQERHAALRAGQPEPHPVRPAENIRPEVRRRDPDVVEPHIQVWLDQHFPRRYDQNDDQEGGGGVPPPRIRGVDPLRDRREPEPVNQRLAPFPRRDRDDALRGAALANRLPPLRPLPREDVERARRAEARDRARQHRARVEREAVLNDIDDDIDGIAAVPALPEVRQNPARRARFANLPIIDPPREEAANEEDDDDDRDWFAERVQDPQLPRQGDAGRGADPVGDWLARLVPGRAVIPPYVPPRPIRIARAGHPARRVHTPSA